MERIVLIASEEMVYTDIFVWGTKIYLAEDAEEELFFEVPMCSFTATQTSSEDLDV